MAVGICVGAKLGSSVAVKSGKGPELGLALGATTVDGRLSGELDVGRADAPINPGILVADIGDPPLPEQAANNVTLSVVIKIARIDRPPNIKTLTVKLTSCLHRAKAVNDQNLALLTKTPLSVYDADTSSAAPFAECK